MGLSTIATWLPGTKGIENRDFVATSHEPAQNDMRRSAETERRILAHLTGQSCLEEIIGHITQVHHQLLRQSLARLTKLFDTGAGESAECFRQWNSLMQRFVKLRDEMLRCVAHEETVVFPDFLLLITGSASSDLPPGFLSEVEAVERCHARCLQMLWRLLRIAKDQADVFPAYAVWRRVTEELSLLCDGFEQQLFEEECLLFARMLPAPIRKPR